MVEIETLGFGLGIVVAPSPLATESPKLINIVTASKTLLALII
jgi:hypothetical protein